MTKREFSTEIRDDGRQLFDGLYGRGHGEELTIERFQSVLGLGPKDASDLFDQFFAADAKLVE
jgi:hypothetical protein